MVDDFGLRRRSRYITVFLLVFMMAIMLVSWEIFLYLLLVMAIGGTVVAIYYVYALRTPYVRFFGTVLNEGDPEDLFKEGP